MKKLYQVGCQQSEARGGGGTFLTGNPVNGTCIGGAIQIAWKHSRACLSPRVGKSQIPQFKYNHTGSPYLPHVSNQLTPWQALSPQGLQPANKWMVMRSRLGKDPRCLLHITQLCICSPMLHTQAQLHRLWSSGPWKSITCLSHSHQRLLDPFANEKGESLSGQTQQICVTTYCCVPSTSKQCT